MVPGRLQGLSKGRTSQWQGLQHLLEHKVRHPHPETKRASHYSPPASTGRARVTQSPYSATDMACDVNMKQAHSDGPGFGC